MIDRRKPQMFEVVDLGVAITLLLILKELRNIYLIYRGKDKQHPDN